MCSHYILQLQDIQGRQDSFHTEESEQTSEAQEGTSKPDVHWIREKDVQQDLSLETEKMTEMGALRHTGEGSREQTLVEDKTQGVPECISESSLAGPNALVPIDVSENRVAIQNLQLQVKETSDENLRLLRVLEERDKNVEILLSEIKQLGAKLGLQEVQLATKTEACLELGKLVEELKKEKSDLVEKLASFSCDDKELDRRAESSEGLDSSSDAGPKQLSCDVPDTTAAEASDSWRGRFLGVENEPERIQAGHHGPSAAADLELARAEKLCLEKDNEHKQRVITRLEEELSVVTRETDRLRGELAALSEDNKALDLMSEEMKANLRDLECCREECLHRVDEMTAEVQDKTRLLQTASSDVSELLAENAHLQERLQRLEEDAQALSSGKSELENRTGRLNEEKEALVRESESLQSKLRELEHEKLDVAKALQAALVEKGEVAVRLGSTQDEVQQLRSGIEKLRVRIEADDKKQLQVLERLRESERKSDSLQDKVESLERELQMSEENQEMVILEAENSKAELETLKTQMESTGERLKALEGDLVTLRSEKDNLTRQLQEKQGQLSELDTCLSSLKSLLEEKEQETRQMTEESRTAVEKLHTELRELNEAVAALCDDQETGETEETAPQVHRLRSGIEKLKARLEADEKRQLRVMGKLKESEQHAESLKNRGDSLARELELSRTNHEHAILEAETSRAEAETLRAKIEEMAPHLRDLESDLTSVRSEKENLTKALQEEQGRVSELETLNSSLANLLQAKEREMVQMKEESKIAVERLESQLKELSEKVAALHDDQETWKAKEQHLSSQVDYLELEKAQLLQGLEEAKSDCMILQSSVNGFIQEVEDAKRKLEKKEEEIGVLKNQIQDQEQLVSKLSQVEGEQQIWKKQKVDLESLTVELEQKSHVLQSKNDSLQDALEGLQTSYQALEKELEVTKVEKVALVEKVSDFFYVRTCCREEGEATV